MKLMDHATVASMLYGAGRPDAIDAWNRKVEQRKQIRQMHRELRRARVRPGPEKDCPPLQIDRRMILASEVHGLG